MYIFHTFSLCKNFLRNIQGGVFFSMLYDKWLAVIGQANKKERISAVQRELSTAGFGTTKMQAISSHECD